MAAVHLVETPWKRLKELARKQRGVVAVPFIGRGAASLLPLKEGSVLVTRMNLSAVRQGLVDPREVAMLMRRGVKVFDCPNLHAKVYVFGKRALVGSANVSRSSSELLIEACLETTEARAVSDARSFVLKLAGDAVGFNTAKLLFEHYTADRTDLQFSTPMSGEKPPRASRLWVVSTEDRGLTLEAKVAAAKARPVAQRRINAGTSWSLDVFDFDQKGWTRFKEGDRFVCRWGRRPFKFQSPARILHIEPYEGGAIFHLERRKGLHTRTTSDVRRALGVEASAFCFDSNITFRAVASEAAASVFERLWAARGP